MVNTNFLMENILSKKDYLKVGFNYFIFFIKKVNMITLYKENLTKIIYSILSNMKFCGISIYCDNFCESGNFLLRRPKEKNQRGRKS